MKKAFTLVELAIVLVIIGLLVVGVVGGQNLIDSSKTNRVVSDFKNFETAFHAYNLEYDAIPGDHKTFTDYFGTVFGTTALYNSNGDGNKEINFGGAPDEDVNAWCHLAESKLVAGKYTGDYSSGKITPGINAPTSPWESIGYWLVSTEPSMGSSDTAYQIQGRAGNRVALGGDKVILFGGANGAELDGGAATPKVARNIDQKLDDGIAKSGNIRSISRDGTCVNSSNEYYLSQSNKACFVNYFLD